MNLQKNKNKKKLWLSFLGFLVASFSLATILPISCGKSNEAAKTSITTDAIPTIEKQESKITNDENLFTFNIKNQNLTTPTYFLASGKTSAESLKKMNINIPDLSQGIRREYEIKELIWAEKASFKIETTIFADNTNKQINLNISFDLNSDQKTILKNMDSNIAVTKKSAAKVYYKYAPKIEHLDITEEANTTQTILKAEYVNDEGKSKIKMEFTNSSLKLEKIFNVEGFDNKDTNEELLAPINAYLKEEGRIEIENNKYEGETIPFGFVIPENITKINRQAFKKAILPLNFTIPSTIITLDLQAFSEAVLSPGFSIYDSYWSKDVKSVDTWNDGAFDKVIFLSDFTISDTVTHIGDSQLETVIFSSGFKLPNKLETIGAGSFAGATLPLGFTIPDSVTSIGADSFRNSILPLGFTISDSVTSIGSRAFIYATLPNEAKWFNKDHQKITEIRNIAGGSYIALNPKTNT